MPERQRSRGRKPDYQLRIAKERMDILFDLAKKELRKNPDRSRRYVLLACKIGTRYNIRVPSDVKRGFCKHCGTLFIPGLTSSQRTEKGAITVKCLNCQRVNRYVLKGLKVSRKEKRSG